MNNGGGAAILATENVLTRMSAPTGQVSPFPTAAWPSDTFGEDEHDLYLNGQGIQTLFQPAAHTDGDAIVFFRRSDVVLTGEIFDTTQFPVIDVARGGGIQGEIDALNHVIDITIPAIPLVWQEGGTLVFRIRPSQVAPRCGEGARAQGGDRVFPTDPTTQAWLRPTTCARWPRTKGFRFT